MATIDYAGLFGLLDRMDPDVLDMPQDKTTVEDTVADLKLAFGETACAGSSESAGADSLGPAIMDVIVQCENVLAGTREAASHWQEADRTMAGTAEYQELMVDAASAEKGALG